MAFDLLLGPLVGAIGGAVSQWSAYKSKQLDVEDRKSQREHDAVMAKQRHQEALEMHSSQADATQTQVALEGEVKFRELDQQGLNAAVAAMPNITAPDENDGPVARWYKIIIASMQTLVRVFLTIYLGLKLAYVADLVIEVMVSTPVKLSDQIVGDMYELVLRGFIEISLTAIAFWFASRGSVLKPQRLNAVNDGKME